MLTLFLNPTYKINLFFFNPFYIIPFSSLTEVSTINQIFLLPVALFFSGILIINFNYANLLISLMGIELILLGSNFNFLMNVLTYKTFSGYVYALFTLTVSAVETGIGISILVLRYKTYGTVNFDELNNLTE